MRSKRLVVLVTSLVCLLLAGAGNSKLFTQVVQKVRFDGKQDHSITLAEASELTGNYQKNMSPEQVIGGYFGEDAIAAILQQEGVKGLRYYYGKNPDGSQCLVLVGVDEYGNDVADGLLAERGALCPPLCSASNPLNTPETAYTANF